MPRVRTDSFLNDCSGAAAVDYGLIVALIAVTIMGSLSLLGERNAAALEKSAETIAAAGS